MGEGLSTDNRTHSLVKLHVKGHDLTLTTHIRTDLQGYRLLQRFDGESKAADLQPDTQVYVCRCIHKHIHTE